jgi:dTDP-4-amino-4,6-dideoxygalactose transaminase
MNVPFFDPRRSYARLREEIEPAVLQVLSSGSYVLGPEVNAFEEETTRFLGAGCSVGVSSGTDALLMVLMALDVGPGDAVITTPYTFFATAEIIARLGARPVFVDIEPEGFCVDPAGVTEALRAEDGRAKAVVPVHLFGECAAMEEILAACRDHDCPVVEDAAQAFGAAYVFDDGRRAMAGAMGDFGCFSFYPSKNLATMGDGGLIAGREASRRDSLVALRNHGACGPYLHDRLGGNFRLEEIHAAILRVKLRHLAAAVEGRQRVAAWYDRFFEESGLTAAGIVRLPQEVRPRPGEPGTHVRNQYVVRVNDRDALRKHLTGCGIGTSIYYPVPLHLQAVFADLGYREGDLPRAEAAASEALALPIWPELAEEEVATVVAQIAEFSARG